MSYTEQDVERVAAAMFDLMIEPRTPDQGNIYHRLARAALEAMEREPLENVLRVKNWKVTFAHSHMSDGEAIDDAWFAYVVDWHTGKHLAHENGATMDEAIRAAVAAAKEEKA